MRTVRAIRYLTPLREGGSVPAIVEADDDGTYVAKFRGAAQGPRALSWEPGLAPPPARTRAAAVVWFDALVTNVDRTPRNPNLLRWHRALYLIDPVSYTHLRAHETPEHLVCRL